MAEFNFSTENIKHQWKTNKRFKLGVYISGGIIAGLLSFLSYRQFFWLPADKKADDGWWIALNLIEKDSTDQAIKILKPFVKKYDGHTGGEIGQYLLATQYMKKGEFQKALKELEDVSVNDTYLSTMTIGLQGDCLSELKKYSEAAEMYNKAAKNIDNEYTSPTYFFKAGLHAELAKKYKEATAYFTIIQDEYPDFAAQKTIEKYIARTSTVTNK